MAKERTFDGWVSVFRTGTDYEADLVRDRLDDSGIPAVVLTQRDHAFNLNLGDLAKVHVFVPQTRAEEARALMQSPPVSEEELAALALKSDPNHPPDGDRPMLDTGADRIRLGPPPERDPE